MRRLEPAEDGFTLIELIVTSVIVGIITFAVGTSMLIGLRTTFVTSDRLSQSNNSQQLGQFLIPDVASAAPGGIDATPAATTGCTGSVPAGTNVLALRWTNNFSSDTARASYRYEAPVLARYACVNGGALTRTVILRELSGAPTVASGTTSVVMTATVLREQSNGDDYTFSVRASRRTPSTVCEPEQSSVVVSPVPVAVASGTLAANLTVTFATSGPCTSATVQHEFDSTNSLRTVGATSLGSGGWSATIPASTGWTVGTKSLYVRAGSLSATTTFGVYDPTACTLAGGPTATPNPVDRAGSSLVAPVAVAWTTVGTCSNTGSLTFQYGTAATEVQTTTTVTRVGNSWTAQVPATLAASAVWTDGVKSYSFSADVATGSGTFRVVPAAVCAFVSSPVANPTTVALSTGHVTVGKRLASTVQVTFTTEATCTAATLDYGYGVAGSPVGTVTATGSGGSWTATIPVLAPNGGDWTTGVKTLTARTGTLTRSGSLTVSAGCGVVGDLTFTPAKGKMANGNKLQDPVTVTFTSSASSPPCVGTNFTLRYQYGATTTDSTTATVTGSGTSWSATLPVNAPGSGQWTSGTKPVTVTVGASGDQVVTTANLVVDP